MYTYISIRWTVVGSTAGEGVLVDFNDISAVELLQDAHQCPAIPVVGHSATVVALAGQVAHCCKRDVLQGSRYRRRGSF